MKRSTRIKIVVATVAVVAVSSTVYVISKLGGIDIPSVTPTPTEVTYFAEIDKNGNVLRVIVANQAFINSGAVGDPVNWIQTFKDGITRKNYASSTYKYDKIHDYFIPPDPQVPGETFDNVNAKWIIPTPTP